jgi:alpha-tubulin suppressor-like RCC1 family protein
VATAVAALFVLARSRPATADSPIVVTAVGTGNNHTCALTGEGGIKCWGGNFAGQLGIGTFAGPEQCTIGFSCSTTPVDVQGLPVEAAVSAGSSHTCALSGVGGVMCWGRNDDGQLGNGTETTSNTPVDVIGLTSGVAAISVGGSHTCALTSAGGVKCWGLNNHGQLGNSIFGGSVTPVDVIGLTSGVAAVSAGGYHTCALTTGGGVKCWGLNGSGQLGNASTLDSSTPVDASGLASGVSAVSAGGGHTCVLNTAGGAKCWGSNISGQLGNGTTINSSTPVDVSGLTNAIGVSAGGAHTCALTTTGGVVCWGDNSNGELGQGTKLFTGCGCIPTPLGVMGLSSGVQVLSAGGGFVCARLVAGGLKCWGWNYDGELGNGTYGQNEALPVSVLGLKPTPTPTLTLTASATRTPTSTPRPVGGISSDAAVPGSNPYWLWAPVGVAAAAAAASATVLFARRRLR